MQILIISIIVFFIGCSSCCQPSNTFEATSGCLQYNAKNGYNFAHPYFPMGQFRYMNVSPEGVRLFRMGVLGNNDGHLRLSPTMFPYDSTEMNEIVLSGWANTKTVVRRYNRVSPSQHVNQTVLKEQSSMGMLSFFEPFMFTVAVHPGGLVQLTKDHDSLPFLEYRDPKVSANYLGFCNWDVPLVFFFDCPPRRSP